MKNVPLYLPIARPPWGALGRRLESLCRKAIYTFSLLEKVEGKLAIALSGGKDSLTLLYLLKAILGRGAPHLPLVAIQVTGPYSCGASLGGATPREICEAMEVEYIACEPAQKERALECYSCSRERRSLIFAAAKNAKAHTIAFGHHRDDNIQTLLMNALHKGEFAGNLPKVEMMHYGVTIIRPLIYVTEEEIRSFAKLYGYARITCQCPIGQNSLRKKTEDLLKHLEEVYPNARGNLAKIALEHGSLKALKP